MNTADHVDPVTFEVVWHQLLDITEQMGIKYMRTSGSPVLVGAYDAATAITLPSGELVAMGPYITTQAHVMRLLIESTMRLRGGADAMAPGDMWITNDPYLGATHQPDVATLAPVHHGDELRAWVGSSGHWLDIGGSEPGGFNMNATSVFDEGLRMSPLRIMRGGHVQEDVVDLIMSNVRDPLVQLDVRGQMVSNDAGRSLLQGMFEKYGPTTVEAVMRRGLDHSEDGLRRRLRMLPDGVWRDVQYLDHDGHGFNPRPIVCTLTKRGDQLTLDFSGSASEVNGFANCAFGGLRAAALSGICVTLGYGLTWNDGIARCVDIKAPRRTIVTAEYPTPVSMSTISAVIVTLNLVIGIASKLLLSSPSHRDEAMAAWCGTSIGYSIGGVNERGQYGLCAEASHFAGGCGARTYADGVDTGGIIINTTANIPSIEETESEYPVLYLTRHQVCDSGGAGKYRGGMSGGVSVIPYRSQGELETSFAGAGAQVPNGIGLAGGFPGSALRILRYSSAGTVQELADRGRLPTGVGDVEVPPEILPPNMSRVRLPADTIEYHSWQGAGGYGDPLERDPDAVRRDVDNGSVSIQAARDVYGVVLSDQMVDDEATGYHRDSIRKGRVARASRVSEHVDRTSTYLSGDMAPSVLQTSGSLVYGEFLVYDFYARQINCARCGYCFGSVTSDFRLGCLFEEAPITISGVGRGEEHHDPAIVQLCYYCVCGVQIESEVHVAGNVAASSVILGMPSAGERSS